MNTAHPDLHETTSPPNPKKAWAMFLAVAGMVALAAILCCTATSCVGAPHSVDDLITMPEPQFQNWQRRLANGAKYGATKLVQHNGANVGTCADIAVGLRALVGQPIAPDALERLKPSSGGSAEIAFFLDELQAWLTEYVSNLDSERLAAVMPRVASLLLTCADAIEVGAASALAESAMLQCTVDDGELVAKDER